jgi:hypothetical protein
MIQIPHSHYQNAKAAELTNYKNPIPANSTSQNPKKLTNQYPYLQKKSITKFTKPELPKTISSTHSNTNT